MIENGQMEIRLAGSGGQGLVLASIILAEGAAEAGYYATQFQSYGPEARGGASRAELIISTKAIGFPLVRKPDIFLALTGLACEKYRYELKETGIMVLDEIISEKLHIASVQRYPILATARREFGRELQANIIATGIVNRIGPGIELGILEKIIIKKLPASYGENNIKALHLGNSMVR